jgi:hypothetical protein
MAVSQAFQRVVTIAMITLASGPASMAQEPREVPGLWVFDEARGGAGPKLAIIESKEDIHGTFFRADCDYVRSRMQINFWLDIDPKQYHRFLLNDEWIWLRIAVGTRMQQMPITSIAITR